MIRVERDYAPAFAGQPDFRAARERDEAFRSEGGARTTRTHLDVVTALGSYVAPATSYVGDLVHGKCAYTEVPVEPQLLLHRPETDAFDERLPSSPDHYWWTAFWYRNWYTASGDIFSLKRN